MAPIFLKKYKNISCQFCKELIWDVDVINFKKILCQLLGRTDVGFKRFNVGSDTTDVES